MTNFYEHITCAICGGAGYEYEQVDDKREKRPCPCNLKAYTDHIRKTAYREEVKAGKIDEEMSLIDHMVESGYAEEQNAKALKLEGMEKVGKHESRDFLDNVMDAFIRERLKYSTSMESADAFRESKGYEWHYMNADLLKKFFHKRYYHCRLYNDIHPNSWGALFGRYAKDERIVSYGKYVASTEPSSHGRKIAVWTINKSHYENLKDLIHKS